jgi:hypothetical protein
MKVLLACLNVNGLGGSELYHYELAKELHSLCDLTLFTLREIDPNDQVRIKLNELGIKQVDLSSLNLSDNFDIVVASQPQVNQTMINCFAHSAIPIVSIIHSEVRSEDPVLNPTISHYIGIRQPIVDMLVNHYKIDKNKVSLIYNPIDQSRFNNKDLKPLEKTTGLFVGEVLDSLRSNTVNHLVHSCIENDWDLLLMSESKYDFNHPNIKYIDKTWNTENILKQVHFTAGILLGRTTLESWCCDVPSYIYNIDVRGNLLEVITDEVDNIKTLCDSKNVAQQHLELYKKLLNK